MFTRALVSVAFLVAFTTSVLAAPNLRKQTTQKSNIPKPEAECPPRSKSLYRRVRRKSYKAPGLQLFERDKTKSKPKTESDLQSDIFEAPASKRALLYYQLAKLQWNLSQQHEQRALNYDRFRGTASWPQKHKRQKAVMHAAKKLRKKAAQTLFKIIRTYPKHPKRCQVYYLLGLCFQSLEKTKIALQMYRILIRGFSKQYPACPYVPHAYLALGEYYFNNGQVRTALKSYLRVLKFRKNSVYNFALYKAAWSYYNLVMFRRSLQTFVKVIERTRNIHKTHPRVSMQRQRVMGALLRREAQRDLVMSYSQVGKPKQAFPFFSKYNSAKQARRMLKRLGDLYRAQGKYVSGIKIYVSLEQQTTSVAQKLYYQLEMLQLARRVYSMSQVFDRVLKLAQLLKRSQTKPTRSKKLKQVEQQICCEIRKMAQTRHAESQKTRRIVAKRQAAKLYSVYLKTCPRTRNSYRYHFWLGEILFQLQSYQKAAKQYTQSFQLKKTGAIAEHAAFNAVVAYGSLLPKGSKRSAGPTTQVSKRPLSSVQQQAEKASLLFLQHFPNSKNAPTVQYNYARWMYRTNRFARALPHLLGLVKKSPKNSYSMNAAHFVLDIYNIQKQWKKLQQAALQFHSNPKLGNPLFKKEVLQIVQQSSYKLCQMKSRSNNHQRSGDCFATLAAKFPRSRLADKALFNAALLYHKAKNEALEVNVRLQLLNHYPKSKLNRTNVWTLASYFSHKKKHRLAARYFGVYASRYRQSRRIFQAMLMRAKHTEQAGAQTKAIRLYREVLSQKRWRRRNPKQFAAIYFHVAKHYKTEKNYKVYSAMMKFFLKKRLGSSKQRRFAMKEYRWAQKQKKKP